MIVWQLQHKMGNTRYNPNWTVTTKKEAEKLLSEKEFEGYELFKIVIPDIFTAKKLVCRIINDQGYIKEQGIVK